MSGREIRCPDCGATKKALDDAMILVCEYCGGFIGLSGSIDTRMAAGRKAIEMFNNPTEATQRFMVLAQQLAPASQRGDRETWRTIAMEYYLLYAVLYPENVIGEGREAVAAWVREAVSTAELNNFDPQVKPYYDGYTQSLAAMTTGGGDPVAAGRAALEASTRYHEALLGSSQCPPTMMGKNPGKLAADMLETTLVGMTTAMGQEAVERIKTEVLGLTGDTSDQCSECGASLAQVTGSNCPFCGSALQEKDTDPWVTEQVAIFENIVAASPQFTQDTALYSALGLVYNALRVEPSFPADRAVRFLQKVVPWSNPSQIMQKARLILAAEGNHFLGPLQQALGSWSPEQG